MSHAGIGIADLYAKSDPRSQDGVAFLPYPAHAAASSWLRVACGVLLQALIAWDYIRPGRPNEENLTRMADELGVRSAIELRDT